MALAGILRMMQLRRNAPVGTAEMIVLLCPTRGCWPDLLVSKLSALGRLSGARPERCQRRMGKWSCTQEPFRSGLEAQHALIYAQGQRQLLQWLALMSLDRHLPRKRHRVK